MTQITIIGSMSVGKTTLLNSLKSDPRTQNFLFIPESATQMIEKYGVHPSGMDDLAKGQFQTRVFENQASNEIEARNKGLDFVSDRGIIDGLSYSLDLDIFDDLRVKTLDYLSKYPYTQIIYLPIEFSFDSTGRHIESSKFQKEVDDNLRFVLNDLGLEFVTLTGNIEERKEKLLKLLF